ncbi:MAG: putative transport system ATP-binding protein [Myxococcales bacterium]|nr:putative transport system ATP-binding protein [Myxococcales bacterium]
MSGTRAPDSESNLSNAPEMQTTEVEVPEQYRNAKASEQAGEKAKGKTAYRDTNAKTIIELKGVTKTFVRGKEPLTVLDGLTLDVHEGAFEALMGPSGSGKSTLLNLIAGLDRPTSGVAKVAGNDLSTMSDGDLARFRSRHIGFIFQAYNLMPVLTALENVELPLLLTKLSSGDRRKRAQTALRAVGLEDRMGHYPRQLSGGQEQRVAIARAIVNDPTIIVADEPTGDLDRKAADDILSLLTKLNEEFKKTILMVTHDPAAAERATATRHLNKGKLE